MSTETVGLLGTGAQDGHLDFHRVPELTPQPRTVICTADIGKRGTKLIHSHTVSETRDEIHSMTQNKGFLTLTKTAGRGGEVGGGREKGGHTKQTPEGKKTKAQSSHSVY